jgi:hypothetical protein
MKSRTSADKLDRLGILPIRVGDGDVEGVLFNTIVPDIRKKSLSDAAELIVRRLSLIKPIVERAGPAGRRRSVSRTLSPINENPGL